MSHRRTEDKKLARLRKQLRKNANHMPVMMDLVDFLQTHCYASNAGQARKIILDKRVKANSHTLGVTQVPKLVGNTVVMEDAVAPLVPADLRSSIVVLPEKA